MKLFFITLIAFLMVIFGMALGYILKRRTIQGSCGGITALGMKKVCDCDTPCDKRRQQLEQEQQQ